MLTKDFPPKSTVYDYFRLWKDDGIRQHIHDTLRGEVRAQAGRDATPSASIINSQSIKTTEKRGSRRRRWQCRSRSESAGFPFNPKAGLVALNRSSGAMSSESDVDKSYLPARIEARSDFS